MTDLDGTKPPLEVDWLRCGDEWPTTGIHVRARLRGEFAVFDISHLTRSSLYQWLRSRGGSNLWAENTVLVLLGHEPIGEGNKDESTGRITPAS